MKKVAKNPFANVKSFFVVIAYKVSPATVAVVNKKA